MLTQPEMVVVFVLSLIFL